MFPVREVPLLGKLPVVEINFFCWGDNVLLVCQMALRNSQGRIYNRFSSCSKCMAMSARPDKTKNLKIKGVITYLCNLMNTMGINAIPTRRHYVKSHLAKSWLTRTTVIMVRSNTSSRTRIGEGSKVYSVRFYTCHLTQLLHGLMVATAAL